MRLSQRRVTAAAAVGVPAEELVQRIATAPNGINVTVVHRRVWVCDLPRILLWLVSLLEAHDMQAALGVAGRAFRPVQARLGTKRQHFVSVSVSAGRRALFCSVSGSTTSLRATHEKVRFFALPESEPNLMSATC